MRIANLAGRPALIAGTGDADGPLIALDVARASEGRFGADPRAVWGGFAAFSAWASGIDVAGHPEAAPFEVADLASPVPAPLGRT